MTGAESGGHTGPFLELAYWIGQTPGQTDSNVALNRYRDGQQPGDRFAVLHLHTLPRSELLRNEGGRTYIGINRIQVYHAEHTRLVFGGGWRVDGRDRGGVNSRDGWECPGTAEESLWYIGSPRDLTDLTGADVQFWAALQTWAQNLFATGYVGAPAQTLITRGSAFLANGDIDPRNIGQIIGQNDVQGSSQLGGQDPYSTSFTIHNYRQPKGVWRWEYNLAPRRPL
jgi:chitinase